MKYLDSRYLIVCVAMLAAAGLALAMTPTIKIADGGKKFVLENMIPHSFDEWRVDPNVIPLQPSPDLQATIDKFYEQTLARTYVNLSGERVMLSIAYGGEQSRSLQVHKPEGCYAAQGFMIQRESMGQLASDFGAVPVKRVVAEKGPRTEPITYWVTTGDKVTHDGLSWRLAQLRYGLSGEIPDGIVFRVSTISKDVSASYAIHDKFVNQLLAALNAKDRGRLIGNLASR